EGNASLAPFGKAERGVVVRGKRFPRPVRQSRTGPHSLPYLRSLRDRFAGFSNRALAFQVDQAEVHGLEDRLAARGDLELPVDVLDVRRDRATGDTEQLPDLGDAEALRDQVQDLELAIGEERRFRARRARRRLLQALEQVARDRRADRRAAREQLLDRSADVLGGPVLEEVP